MAAGMPNASTSGLSTWKSSSDVNLTSLNLSLGSKIQIDEEIEEDELEEVEVDERERLRLQQVSSLVEAAYQRVEKFSSQNSYHIRSAGVSETSSCQSTLHHAASLPESLDGGKAEVEELKTLPHNFDSALRINQALQRRLNATLARLEKTLEENLLSQVQLKEKEEEEFLLSAQDKDYKETRNKYFIRPSSFSIPYFKDRTGMPAPMNKDAKYKVDHGYLDLYSTRLRTWLTSEQNSLVREVQRTWKEKLISDWTDTLKTAERKWKNPDLSEEDKAAVEEEVKRCENHISFFTNVSADKIDMPIGSPIDWDCVSARAFDGYRSTEECKLIWENYLHPSINRGPWTEEEDIDIQETVFQSEDQHPNWEDLASKLNTGRTGCQVMERWVSFIRPTIQPARWTPEESKKLEDTINMLRIGSHIPWAQVSQHLPGYTKVQLQSRWRIVNPDQSRGPFTSEEDFVLIKGLYKFGMNFELIAHFLPGRNRVQVRNRFKNAIMSGLTTKPWAWFEDKKIILNCSMKSQHWRKMAMLLPKRDTCQIRLRFYILHFWQTISKENKLPPPLFPLSMTRKPQEIKKLREKIVKLNPDVRIYLDSISSNQVPMNKLVKPFEERRQAIAEKMDSKNLAKFLQEKPVEPKKPEVVRKKRRGAAYGPRNNSWPDNELIDYFLPGRANTMANFDPNEPKLSENFHSVAQALQLQIKNNVTAANLLQLQENVDIYEDDAALINEVLVEHHFNEEYGEECLSCSGQNPDIIPLIPPNKMTTGAFRSLLVHKPALKKMASDEFLLHHVSRSQLHKLGDKPLTLQMKKNKKEFEIPEEVISKITEDEDLGEGPSNSCEDTSDVNPRGKRKAATMAQIYNYVYSQGSKTGKKRCPEREGLEPPTDEEIQKMVMEGECAALKKRSKNTPKSEIIKEEDKLLFHRMLSLFFWPALFTLTQPSSEKLHNSAQLAAESSTIGCDIPDAVLDPFEAERGRGKLAHIDMDEQEIMIKKLEAVKKRKTRGFIIPTREVRLTQEDMGKRVYKKEIVKLKRSLIMKKTWEKRKKGHLPIKPVKKQAEPRTRPISSRQKAMQDKRQREADRAENEMQEEELTEC